MVHQKYCYKNDLTIKAVNGNLLVRSYLWACGAAVAQGTHNPLVAGSNPAGPKFKRERFSSLF